jgi:hypothetical protein
VRICQFGQDNYWNIYDMTPYEKILPNYDRAFLAEKKALVRGKMTALMENAKEMGILPQDTPIEARGLSTREKLRELGIKVGKDTSLDDSFEKDLANLYDDIEEDAIVTSDEEDEFDYIKGMDLYAETRQMTKKSNKYRAL